MYHERSPNIALAAELWHFSLCMHYTQGFGRVGYAYRFGVF